VVYSGTHRDARIALSAVEVSLPVNRQRSSRTRIGRGRTASLLASLFVLGAWRGTARAHGIDANQIQVVLHEQTVEVLATPPSEFVALADANRDGLLNVDEVRARRDEILRTLVAALTVRDGDGVAGTLDRSDVSVPRGDDEGARGSDFLRLTVVLRWPTPPRAVRLRCGFVSQHPITVYATRADGRAARGMLTLVGDPEYQSLTTPQSEVTVLGTSAPPATPPAPASPATATPIADARRGSPTFTTVASILIVLTLAALAGAHLRRTR
jgi:hypothetical protein